jgi:hypothetical protein
MKLIINCEEDIERGVNELVKLAKLPGRKKVRISFPSELIHEVFCRNLHQGFLENDVPSDVNIRADIIVL